MNVFYKRFTIADERDAEQKKNGEEKIILLKGFFGEEKDFFLSLFETANVNFPLTFWLYCWCGTVWALLLCEHPVVHAIFLEYLLTQSSLTV